MDDQHGILLDTLNEMRLQLVRGGNRDMINDQLGRLVEFTGMHFGCEESLLERHGFPGIREHRVAHARLLQKVREAVEHAEHGASIDLQPMIGSMRGWFLEHMEGFDQQYGPWLNSKGIY